MDTVLTDDERDVTELALGVVRLHLAHHALGVVDAAVALVGRVLLHPTGLVARVGGVVHQVPVTITTTRW